MQSLIQDLMVYLRLFGDESNSWGIGKSLDGDHKNLRILLEDSFFVRRPESTQLQNISALLKDEGETDIRILSQKLRQHKKSSKNRSL